ncbi:MAG: flagellar protein FlgN [Lachnospiraceae bacterium]|nr:flagellar protein FlgN [Lachnospiraceae bacterium]
MAGLMDELISTLRCELQIYKELIPLADKKSGVIIENDTKRLSDITEEEQLAVEKLKVLEKKREGIMVNMRVVLNKRNSELKLEDLIELMQKQPEARQELIELKKNLRETLDDLKTINDRNSKLIKESLEISEYHLNMIRSSRGYIGNNYTRKAGQFDMSMMTVGTFDAKN